MNIIKSLLKICIFIIVINLHATSAKFDIKRLENKFKALTNVLKFMIERPEQMNVDVTILLTWTVANLRAAVNHRNTNYLDNNHRKTLVFILKFAEAAYEAVQRAQKPESESFVSPWPKVNRPEIWMKLIGWRRINNGIELKPAPGLTFNGTYDSLIAGHSTEIGSHYCIMKAALECEFPKLCRDIVFNNENSTTGYPLTHRLFIVQMLSAFQCKTEYDAFFPYIIFKFCAQILQDLVNNEAMGFPYVTRDLASEQELMCGMEGYLDFLDPHYEDLLLKWQHPSGCFRVEGNSVGRRVFKPRRVRREGYYIDFDCVNHTTGLGASALAVMIRKDIETLRD